MVPRQFPQTVIRPPAGTCEILLVRHGMSEPVTEGISQPLVDGQGDPALDPVGEIQARRVADRLVSTRERIAAIYVTTMRRTQQTAAPLAERLGLQPTIIRDLREVHLGEWEGGLYRQRVADGDPIAARLWNESRWDVIPGAEPTDAFEARIRAGVQRIATAHPDEIVVAVVHGGVIAQIAAMATGGRAFAFVGADNASISHLLVTPDRWVLRCFNDTSHLTPTFRAAAEPLT